MIENTFDKRFITPAWELYNKELEAKMHPDVPWNFMEYPSIECTMASRGATYTPYRLKYLENNASSGTLRYILHESCVGNPYISNEKYVTSDMMIGHAYHYYRYGECAENMGKVLEWGGGYGGLARLIKAFDVDDMEDGHITEYTIVDTPIMSHIQKYYLSFFAPDVECISLNELYKLDGREFDTFISMFALNECPNYVGDWLLKNKWFGAKRFMFAYLPDSNNVDAICSVGGRDEPCEEIPPNRYRFK